jgi:hypothetical protein
LDEGNGQITLCETDYFRRLDLICHNCGGALRGPYITASDRKYHTDHFTCNVCPKAFGAGDSYFEHETQVYCREHFATMLVEKQRAMDRLGEERFEKKSRAEKRDWDRGALKNVLKKFTGAL